MLENVLEWQKPVPVPTHLWVKRSGIRIYGGVGVGPLLDFRATSFREKKNKKERKKKILLSFISLFSPRRDGIRTRSAFTEKRQSPVIC